MAVTASIHEIKFFPMPKVTRPPSGEIKPERFETAIKLFAANVDETYIWKATGLRRNAAGSWAPGQINPTLEIEDWCLIVPSDPEDVRMPSKTIALNHRVLDLIVDPASVDVSTYGGQCAVARWGAVEPAYRAWKASDECEVAYEMIRRKYAQSNNVPMSDLPLTAPNLPTLPPVVPAVADLNAAAMSQVLEALGALTKQVGQMASDNEAQLQILLKQENEIAELKIASQKRGPGRPPSPPRETPPSENESVAA